MQLLRLCPFQQVDLPVPATVVAFVLVVVLELLPECPGEELQEILDQYLQHSVFQHLKAVQLDPVKLKELRRATPLEEHLEMQDQLSQIQHHH